MNLKKKEGKIIENSIYSVLRIEQPYILDCKKKINETSSNREIALIISDPKDPPLRGCARIKEILKERRSD